ncbi:unknown [[Mannheimia] succiniciproducens MBEL55E]|uniref:Uncharacterized protein n=1 Tax=Mannheimia succiniciproducens (strain KCTC 0769BP / MBEL55E) TaxID=221988 RepID=Q65S35_MANSM|nr:unknown [[Mannheimia] succiniciproducens MBEL55E]
MRSPFCQNMRTFEGFSQLQKPADKSKQNLKLSLIKLGKSVKF